MKIQRSTFYYKPKTKKDDTHILESIHEISRDLNQIGYISMTRILKNKGYQVGKKRIYRIMKENGLLCRKKGKISQKLLNLSII